MPIDHESHPLSRRPRLVDCYTQVRLTRPDGEGGSFSYLTWIPSRFALVGERIKVRTTRDWGPAWTVAETFQTISADQASYMNEHGYRRFRRVLEG